MILIDTSVWLKFFRGENEGRVVRPWILGNEALLHPFVLGELILGGLSQENNVLLRSIAACDISPPDDTFAFIRKNKLTNRGIGWVDAVLLEAGARTGARIASYDGRLAGCAREFGRAEPIGDSNDTNP